MWFSIVCNGVVFISSLNHSDLDVKFQEEFKLCSSLDPGRRTTTRMSVCLVNTPQVSVLSTFLFLKISFYSSHPKVLISICRMLSKGLIFYDLHSFWSV